MRTSAPLFTLASLFTLLPAQDKASPFRFVPGDCIAVARIGGVGKWKTHFAKTQIAKLLQGQSLAPVAAMLDKKIGEGLAEMRTEGKVDADLIDGLLKNYAGDVVVGLRVDTAAIEQSMTSGEAPAFGVVVVLAPDGSYDLAKLASALDKAAESDADLKLRDLAIGDTRLRVQEDEDGSVSVPQMIDGHLVMIAGNDLANFGSKVMASDARWAAPADDKPLFVHLQLDAVLETVIKVGGDQMAMMGTTVDGAQLLRDMGLGALTGLSLSLGAEGAHMIGEYSVSLKEGDRGLFGLLGNGSSQPKLLRAVPPASESFTVMPFRTGELLNLVGKIWGGLGDEVPMTWEAAQAAVTDALKVRLKEDLFDHLGDELMVVQDPEVATTSQMQAEMDEDEAAGMFAMFAGSCIGISLRDGKAFGESVEKMLRARGLHAARKTEEYQGTKVHKLVVGGVLELEYAIAPDVLLLGIGGHESTKHALRTVLDARSATDAGLPTVLKDHLAGLPGGWCGISCAATATQFEAIGGVIKSLEQLEEMQGESDADSAAMLQALTGIGKEMRQLGISHSVTTTYSTPAGMRFLIRW